MVPNPIKMDDLGGFPYFWKHAHEIFLKTWGIFMVLWLTNSGISWSEMGFEIVLVEVIGSSYAQKQDFFLDRLGAFLVSNHFCGSMSLVPSRLCLMHGSLLGSLLDCRWQQIQWWRWGATNLFHDCMILADDSGGVFAIAGVSRGSKSVEVQAWYWNVQVSSRKRIS